MGNRDNIPADTLEQISFSLMTVPDILPMGKYFIFLNTSHIEFVLETLNIYQMVLFQLLLVINISLVLEAVWILQGMKNQTNIHREKRVYVGKYKAGDIIGLVLVILY